MSTRSGTLAQETLSVESVKRKLDFDELRNCRTEAEYPRALTWRKKKGRRLDFGETDPSVLLRCPDLLPNRCDFDSVAMPLHREKRTVFTAEQKATLEATFRNKTYLSREEKASLAAKLDVGIAQVQNWFNNRRQKWRREQKKGAVGPSGLRPILPRTYLIDTSCKQSFKSAVSFDGIPQFPAHKQVPTQPLYSPQVLAIFQPASASQQMTQSYTASSSSSGTQLYPKQHLPAPLQSSAKEVRLLPLQQGNPGQPRPVTRIPQHQPESSQIVQHTAASSYPSHRSLPLVNPVEQDIHQLTAVESSHLADEFPFSYSIAKENPHIFGNLQEDEIPDRSLTPSFAVQIESDPLWDPLLLESDHAKGNQATPSNADLVDCASANYRRVQPSRLNSCCFENGDLLSPPTLGELSCSLFSKEETLGFADGNNLRNWAGLFESRLTLTQG